MRVSERAIMCGVCSHTRNTSWSAVRLSLGPCYGASPYACFHAGVQPFHLCPLTHPWHFVLVTSGCAAPLGFGGLLCTSQLLALIWRRSTVCFHAYLQPFDPIRVVNQHIEVWVCSVHCRIHGFTVKCSSQLRGLHFA